MPLYEYYCPSCRTKFERLRAMSFADDPVSCAAGHAGARRLVSAFVFGGRAATEEASMPTMGCACGGACSCGH
jgi:putative FmdB family regulatory protein